MNCERCKKKHATLHIVTCENGQHREIHLCEGCGRKAGLSPLDFTIEDLLGLPKKATRPQARRRLSPKQCPGCKLSIVQIKEMTRAGCARCYETFRDDFLEFAESYHKATQHLGKVPSTADQMARKEAELQRLKDYLEVVVKKEDYEEAAQIRDRIKRLEESLRGAEG